MYPTTPVALLRETVALDAIKGTSGTLAKGQAVYVTGFDTVKLALKVEPARSDATGTMEAIGFTSTSFDSVETGKVIVQGELVGVDTSGFTLNAGLYVSSTAAGAVVSTPPVGPNLRQALGIVSRVNAVDGRILVLSRGPEALSDVAVSTVGGTNLSGTAALAARSDHVHSHGNHLGGSLHALATTSIAGFLSAADKTKLDSTAALSDVAASAVGVTGSAGVATEASRSDHVHAHGDQGGGSLHALATTSVAGFLSAADKVKLDSTVLSDAAASDVGVTGLAGTATSTSRSDHVHAHGSQGGGSLHALATTSVAGFMSAADKVKVDATPTLSDVAAAAVGVTGSAGVAATASRGDHVHAHGDLAGGSLHALATTSVAGFLSAADKVKLDATSTSLSSTLWVDAGTAIGALLQDGSTERPYSTVTAAVARANASATTHWHFIVEFGDYSAEAQVTIPQNRIYVFRGVAKIGPIMTLPTFRWQPSGNLTSVLIFRTAVIGKVEIVDGVGGAATDAVLVFDQCEVRGVEQLSGAGSIRVNITGRTAPAFTSATSFSAIITQPVVLLVGALILAYCQVGATLTVPLLDADSCTINAAIVVTGTLAELRSSGWLQSALGITFTNPPATLFLDSMTDASFHNNSIVLTGSLNPRLTDEIYDLSVYLPHPQDITSAEGTRVTQTTFDGAVFSIGRWVRFSQVYVRLTAQSGGATTLVVAFYQRHDRHSENPQTLVGSGSLVTTAGGAATVLVPMTSFVELGPGPVWVLYGKVAGGGTATVRTYATGAADFLNDPAVVPSTAYPTSFTTNISVTTSPPSTLNPIPAGGVVTPSGTSNLPLMFRTSP